MWCWGCAWQRPGVAQRPWRQVHGDSGEGASVEPDEGAKAPVLIYPDGFWHVATHSLKFSYCG